MLPALRRARDRSGAFVNYAQTVKATPSVWHTPASESELAEHVAAATRAGRRLHVVGAGHSWSAIAAPDEVAVSLEALRGVAAYEQGRVRVRAGTRVRELNRALAQRGLALPILGSVAHQSVAGAIATATHGSSLRHGNLSSLVLGMRAITADGATLTLDEHDPRLDAFRVHLGALAAVTEVTLRTTPAFTLAQTIETVPVQSVAARVGEIGESAEYVKVWWLPHTPTALIFRYARTSETPKRRSPAAAERILENWGQRAVLPAWLALQRRRPAVVPAFNAVVSRASVKSRRIGPSPLMLSTPDPVRHDETEAAVPLDAGGEAFGRTVRLIERVGVRVNFIVELRYVSGDGAWMSPAFGGDVVQIGAYTALPGHRRAYFDAFWQEMRELRARPHWGKELPHEGAEIRALYPLAERFIALRDALDPTRVFANRFLDRVLGA